MPVIRTFRSSGFIEDFEEVNPTQQATGFNTSEEEGIVKAFHKKLTVSMPRKNVSGSLSWERWLMPWKFRKGKL